MFSHGLMPRRELLRHTLLSAGACSLFPAPGRGEEAIVVRHHRRSRDIIRVFEK